MAAGRTHDSQPSLSSNEAPLLDLKNLKMHFPITRGMLHKVVGQVKAVDDASLSIRTGETFALVGESGCGKTTLGRCIIRIYDPTAGTINYVQPDGTVVDLATVAGKHLKPYRRAIRMIFQDPYSSLNPRRKVLQIVGEPLVRHNIASGTELEDRVAELLRKVGLRPEYILRYPHAFSGGERQRIGIARALALNPRLVIADEAVSALDVSVQAQILNLLQDLQAEFHLTYLFIAHDLSVVEHIADRVAVMYVGKLVEMGQRPDLQCPQTSLHRGTDVSGAQTRPQAERCRRPHPTGRGGGRSFQPAERLLLSPPLPLRQDRCKVEEPALRDIGQEQYAACHFAEQLQLSGVKGV